MRQAPNQVRRLFESGVPGGDGQGDRRASERAPHGRRLSHASRRYLPVSRRRLRQADVAAGCRSLSSQPAGRSRFRRPWNGRVRAMAGTSGSSSQNRCRPVLARRLGAHLLTEAMERNPDIGFESYDRFFPSQDTLPAGGFGNLIALPLEHGPRESGNSLFLDEGFAPWPDQWAFLSSLCRLPLAEAARIAGEAGRQGRVLGLRLPIDDEDEEPWTAPPSRRLPLPRIAAPLPERVDAVLGRPDLHPACRTTAGPRQPAHSPRRIPESSLLQRPGDAAFDVRHSPNRGLRRTALASRCPATRMPRGVGGTAGRPGHYRTCAR